MFFDGPDHYPKSCVVWCWFPTYDVREIFSYLREKEWILQRDIQRFKGTAFELITRGRLEEVEAQLAWITDNIRSTLKPPPRRRSKAHKNQAVQLNLEIAA
jgi:hypothetical protein